MINLVMDAITDAIYQEFGDGYGVDTKKVPQGMQEPCFLIKPLRATDRPFRGERRALTNMFAIHYFARDKEDRSECLQVYIRVNDCLECIEMNGHLVRASELEMDTIEDGVMTIQVSYNFYGKKVVEKDPDMETVSITLETEG